MNDKKFYTIKEIILGTREAYIENQKIMSELRKLTYSYDKQVRDFYFEVVAPKSYAPYIRCKFIQEMKTFRGKIMELKKKMNLYQCGDEIAEIKKHNCGTFEIKNHLYEANIISGEERKFSSLIDQSLNSNFITNVNFSYIHDKQFDIIISPSMIVVRSKDTKNQIMLFYEAKSDHIEVCNPGGVLNENVINHILNYKVSLNSLSPFHQSLINQSNILKKDIILKSYNSYRMETIIIEEKEMEVELVRVRSIRN